MQAHLLLVPLLLLSPLAASQESGAEKKARSLVRSGRHEAAIPKLEEVLYEDPANGWAWFQLASSNHALENYAEAAEANRRAAEFPGYRPSALYNLACAQSLSGKVEEANDALGEARAAGFLDLDLMLEDADLVALRAKHPIELPPKQEYTEITARGRVRMRYKVLEPAGFDPEQPHPVLAVFAPGSGTVSADWIIPELFADVAEQERWVVLVLVSPEGRGWWTHPSHHALEDLFKRLKKEMKVEGERFHLFSFATGCRAASTYSHMSEKYFQSMTVISSSAWRNYDEGDIAGWPLPVHHIVGALDGAALAMAQGVQATMEKGRATAKLTIIEDEGALVPSVRGKRLWELLPR